MALIRVPDRYKVALVQLCSLNEQSIATLLSTLRGLSPTLLRGDIAGKLLSSGIEGITPNQATALLDALLSLYVVKDNSGRSVNEVVQDVSDALQGESQEGHAIPQGQAKIFEERLDKLLSIDAVELCAKATALQTENQKIFATARILTDIRPVFGLDVTAPPATALIVHNLKIEYLESGQQREVYIALSEGDIEEMLEVLVRAKTKTQTLKTLATSSHVTIIDSK